MNGKQAGTLAAIIGAVSFANAGVITGTISNWDESGPVLSVGDGEHHVHLWWSINTDNRGWFYGSAFTDDSDVAFAEGVTEISQIANAGLYTFSGTHIGPCSDADLNPPGDFVIWRNNDTGHFGVLRIDNIHGSSTDARLDATWWFQTDGTGNFVPAPGVWMAVPLLAFGTFRHR